MWGIMPHGQDRPILPPPCLEIAKAARRADMLGLASGIVVPVELVHDPV
jgi:hypothetical protein